MICGALPLVLLGIKDDLIGVRYSHKFIIQILSALLLISSGTYIDNLYGLLGIYELSPYIGIPFTTLLTVYIINSLNLIDGVDGLAATLSIVASVILEMCIRDRFWVAVYSLQETGLLLFWLSPSQVPSSLSCITTPLPKENCLWVIPAL